MLSFLPSYCQTLPFLLTEVVLIRKFNSFLIVNKSAKVMCKISICYNAHCLIVGVLTTPASTIDKTHINLLDVSEQHDKLPDLFCCFYLIVDEWKSISAKFADANKAKFDAEVRIQT